MPEYRQVAKSRFAGFANLAAVMPEPMKRHHALGQESLAEGDLSVNTKELIAVSVAITMKCDGRIVCYAREAASAEACRKGVSGCLV